jgi:hypothetical protein
MPRNTLGHSKQSSQQNNFNYQTLYLWTSFILGMISLGIIVWQRSNGNVISNNAVIPSETRDLLDSHLRGNNGVFNQNYNSIVTYSMPLILSTLAYQQSGNVISGLLFGLGSYLDTTNAQPALTINLSNLTSSEGLVFNGGANAGISLYVTDFNKDNSTDLLIGNNANSMYLAYGPTFNVKNLANLTSQEGVVFSGPSGSGTGSKFYPTDINRDGYMDILIGAIFSNKVYLTYGPNFNLTNLDSLSGLSGVVFTGGGWAGASVYAVDMNGDNHTDILIGAVLANKVYLAYGPNFDVTNLDSLSGSSGVIFTGGGTVGAGYSIYVADMNRDGNLDILIGSTDQGRVYLAYGPFFNITNLENLNGKQGVVFRGSVGAGASIHVADMNRDGNLDILIGGYVANLVYLAYGPVFNVTNLDILNGLSGVVFTGGLAAGFSVYAADVNGDANPDILISASDTVYLVYGPQFANASNLNTLTINQGVVFKAASAQANYAADINGDGKFDIILGGDADKVYVVYNHVFNLFPPPTTTLAITIPVTTTSAITVPIITTSTLAETIMPAVATTLMSTELTQSLQSGSSGSAANSTAAIAGGAAGGVIVLGGAIAACAFWRKKNKKENALDKNTNDKKNVGNKNVSLNSIPRSSEYASFQQDHVNSARTQYAKIDEFKKTENEYDRPVDLKI